MKALYSCLRLAGISLGLMLMLPSWAAAQSVAAPLPAAATPAGGQEKIPHYRVAVDLPEAVKYGAMSIELAKKLSDRDEVGVMISGGTPERLQFERFILMRVGGLYNRFVLGTRETGVGFHGSLRYVYTSGETDATTDAVTDATTEMATAEEAAELMAATTPSAATASAAGGVMSRLDVTRLRLASVLRFASGGHTGGGVSGGGPDGGELGGSGMRGGRVGQGGKGFGGGGGGGEGCGEGGGCIGGGGNVGGGGDGGCGGVGGTEGGS